MDEHISDSDKANEDGSDAHMECLRVKESRSPPISVHSSRKRKSEGRTSSDGKRQELVNWSSRDEEVHQALAIICMREEAKQQPSLMKQVQARLKQHPQISAIGSDFIWSVMDYIHQKMEKIRGIKRVLDLMVYVEWSILPRATDGESGAKNIHRLLNGNRPDLCHKVRHLDEDVFTHLVNIFIEKCLLKESHFIKAAEIVAITLFVLARGVSSPEGEDRFQHSPSTISKYHKQVLDGLVKLSSDIIRPYQSQDELPAKIFQKQGFYWPFFKVWLLLPYTHSHVVIIIYNCENMLNCYSVLKDCIGALDGAHI
ncbi:hypothetical protein Cgig2_003576 [Carnegiea gigantea]|uniref:DUF8040 domain-containing protein n=1 Tax=Carnegiea gigantea TaxID=171969 RepID=A0A9Q1JWR6_9CARY|nr:hypothetical protein Cgig2_003576 [Carnegiea gigantea]